MTSALVIGFCGPPQHGKSTAQQLLSQFGFIPYDDGLGIRKETASRFNLTWQDVTTIEGKSKIINAFGRDMEVREALGLVGKEKEAEFGENYWIDLALNTIDPAHRAVTFGSIRRNQGRSIVDAGGVMIEIINPSKPVSDYDFDQYDRKIVSHTIENTGTLTDLMNELVEVAKIHCSLRGLDFPVVNHAGV